MNSISFEISPSALGEILIISSQEKLLALFFTDTIDVNKVIQKFSDQRKVSANTGTNQIIATTQHELDLYFKKKLREFSVPLELNGTDFQKKVWHALLHIPYGHTDFYAGIARTINKPTASRATGTAIGANNINIIVPCHRVIHTNGRTGNYHGNTKDFNRKEYLLRVIES